jgi:hypothetical protein
VTGVSRPGAPRPVTPNSILAAELEQLADALDAVPGLDEGWRERLRGACVLAGGLDPVRQPVHLAGVARPARARRGHGGRGLAATR